MCLRWKFNIRSRLTLQKQHDKKDMFNLNEEEELTHYGQSLAEMEKFNDLMDSDSEPDEKGLLSGTCFTMKCSCEPLRKSVSLKTVWMLQC